MSIYNSAKILDYKKYANCIFEVLEFLKPNKFSEHTINVCQNNGMRDAETDAHNGLFMDKDWREKREKFRKSLIPQEYKISEEGGETLLTFFTGDKLFYSFKVNNIKRYKKTKLGKNSYVITLIRQPKK